MVGPKVEALLTRHSFKLEHKRIVVGVSGGPDSLALLHYLLKEREKKNIFIMAAHVDHMFRGEESYRDAMFVKEFCEQHRIPFEMLQADVPKIMKETGESSQVAGRKVRYDFYSKMMKKYEAPYVALGHHGDDQMETILMRLTRGSLGKARAGIPFSRPFQEGMIFRPFLGLTKAEIQTYCHEHHLTPRFDPSNDKGIYSRNRFRKQVLPFLKTENSHAHEHFQRFSEELQCDEAYLLELAELQLKKAVIKKEDSQLTIEITRFLAMPMPLQRRGIQLILNYLYKERPGSLSAIHIDQVLSLLHHPEPSGRLDLPNGLKILRSYMQVSFQFQPIIGPEPYYMEANQPGTFILPYGGSIQIQFYEGDIQEPHPNTAFFNVEHIEWPIVIRTRERGDRMTLKGTQGSRKIKDIFIDQKVPVQDRASWPVVTDKNGLILWLPSLKRSSLEGIIPSAKQYIQLIYSK